MINIFKIITNCILTILIYIIVYYYKQNLKQFNIKNKVKSNKIYINIIKKYSKLIEEIYQRHLFITYQKYITVPNILIISTMFFIIAFILFYSVIKVFSTSIILSIFVYLLPYVFLKYMIDKEKKHILYMLPAYIVNLKNYIQQDNNVIVAMKNVICVEPLQKYIKKFNMHMERGMNIQSALNSLKKQVGINKFGELLMAIETCYFNGGKFDVILNKYIEIISKENIHREKIKEKAHSSVIILLIIMLINIYLLYAFILSNINYADIIRNTLIGRVILNINAISYILIGYIVSKIYRTGEKI